MLSETLRCAGNVRGRNQKRVSVNFPEAWERKWTLSAVYLQLSWVIVARVSTNSFFWHSTIYNSIFKAFMLFSWLFFLLSPSSVEYQMILLYLIYVLHFSPFLSTAVSSLSCDHVPVRTSHTHFPFCLLGYAKFISSFCYGIMSHGFSCMLTEFMSVDSI